MTVMQTKTTLKKEYLRDVQLFLSLHLTVGLVRFDSKRNILLLFRKCLMSYEIRRHLHRWGHGLCML